MFRRHRLALAIALLALIATPAAAQNATAERWVDEAERLSDSDPAGSFSLLQRAISVLTSPADRPLRMRAIRLWCWGASSEQPDSQMVFAARGMAEARAAGDAVAMADLLACRGYARDQAGQTEAAVADFDSAIGQAERLKENEVVAQARVLRGELRYNRGEVTGAISDLDTAYRLFTLLADTTDQRYTLNAIANLYSDPRIAQYERALEYYRQVLASNQQAKSRRGIATTYFNIGSTYERMGRLEEALAHYRRSLAMDRERNDPGEVATDRRAIGVVLYKLGRPAESLPVLDQSLAWFQGANDAEGAAGVRLSRGVALRMLGRTQQAIADLETARAVFQAAGNRRFLEKIHEERALAYAQAGDWRSAYQARTAQQELQRTLDQESRAEQSARLRVQLDADKKDQENRALARENALRGQALAAGTRARRLQMAVLVLSAMVIGALVLLAARQRHASRRLRHTALTDELTGLPNRRHLLMLADERMNDVHAGGAGFGVLALDIDHFKRINDTFGHEVGDNVLRRVAKVLQASVRDGDRVGRTGGEEFVALLPGATAATATQVAEHVCRAVERTSFADVHPGLSVSVSIGATTWAPSDDGFTGTWKRADDTLYRAKEAGRNRVEVAAGV